MLTKPARLKSIVQTLFGSNVSIFPLTLKHSTSWTGRIDGLYSLLKVHNQGQLSSFLSPLFICCSTLPSTTALLQLTTSLLFINSSYFTTTRLDMHSKNTCVTSSDSSPCVRPPCPSRGSQPAPSSIHVIYFMLIQSAVNSDMTSLHLSRL